MRAAGVKRKVVNVPENRKLARKMARAAKKSRKDRYQRDAKNARPTESIGQEYNHGSENMVIVEEVSSKKNTIETEILTQARIKRKMKKIMTKKPKKISRKNLEEGIKEDDLIIKRLEKKLRIKKKGNYQEEDILGLSQNLSASAEDADGINWAKLMEEGKSEDIKRISAEDSDGFSEDEIEADKNYLSREDKNVENEVSFSLETSAKTKNVQENVVDGKEFFEQKMKKTVQFSETMKIDSASMTSDTARSHSVFSLNSSDLNEEAWLSDTEGGGSDTEIMEALFGNESDDESKSKNLAKNKKLDDLNEKFRQDVEDHSDIEAEECENSVSIDEAVENGPEKDSSSEEAPQNPGKVFGDITDVTNTSRIETALTVDEKLANLPKSELGETAGQATTGKYMPPAMRNCTSALERSVRGFLNRLSALNIYSIAQEFIKIYQENPQKEVSKFLTKSIFAQILLPTVAPNLLIEDYGCLITILHQKVSENVSFFIIEEIVLKYFQLEKILNDSKCGIKDLEFVFPKDLGNLLSLICCCSRLKLFNTKLLYEILDRLVDKFDVVSVELIQSIFYQSAFILRKENPVELKRIIMKIHDIARQKGEELESTGGNRVKYMLEMITSVKNNNIQEVKKHPQFIDQERDEGCKKRIRSVVGQVQLEQLPAIGLSDILNIYELGRWWRVGAATVLVKNSRRDEDVVIQETVSPALQLAAKKLRLNTQNKRNLFYILNTSEDYMDASNKIFSLNLKRQQRQDVMFVMMEIVQRQKNFNMFYVYVLEKLISTDRSYLMCTQCAMWDKFQMMKEFQYKQIINLAQFLAHAFSRKLLPVTMLKKIEFSDMNNKLVEFLKNMVLELIKLCTQREIGEIFVKLHYSNDLKDFRAGFSIFMQHFILKDTAFMQTVDVTTGESLQLIEQAIASKNSAFML